MTVPGTRTRWLRGVRSPAARLRLVCFPHAGGAAGFFHDWAALTPPWLEVLSVQYPGRQDRLNDPCPATMEELAGTVAEALLQESADGLPVALFGHSMGSAVAYEVAGRLEDAGAAPVRLAVSGRGRPRGPHELAARPAPDDDEILRRVRGLDPAGAAVYDHHELRPVIMPALRADFRMLAAHRPAPLRRLAVPVTACGGDRDPVCPVEDLSSWSDVTSRGVEVRTFEGGHFYLTPRKPEVLALLAERLA
ncbi:MULTISPECIES: thioesterase II family protein [unclassified Streptomyces]|uniref:thioesterase II family protein n=1 Tax=unclassified Streptomyces TaxID=2593676 RepID=UPI000749CF02|nr:MULTISPECIES: alpha/beta fold hydrolase [unclassified Streptomyces]KUL69956.1 thioesterase [Streptomyces sp. NRRL WC-3605]KUL76422.1 thioesterase [Streptomyces sp. NRRL WC-3604]